MRIEVICIQNKWHPDQIKRARQMFNMELPKYGETYHIVNEHNHDKEVYVDLEEYPEQLFPTFIQHSFPKECFAEVQGLNSEIETALKAPNPDKKKHYNDCDGYLTDIPGIRNGQRESEEDFNKRVNHYEQNKIKETRLSMEPPRNMQHCRERIELCHYILSSESSSLKEKLRAELYLKILGHYMTIFRGE